VSTGRRTTNSVRRFAPKTDPGHSEHTESGSATARNSPLPRVLEAYPHGCYLLALQPWCQLEQLDIAARPPDLQLHQSIDVAFDDQKKCSILLALQQLDAAKQTCLDAEKGSVYWTCSYVETVWSPYRGRGIRGDDLAHDQPVEQHADGGGSNSSTSSSSNPRVRVIFASFPNLARCL